MATVAILAPLAFRDLAIYVVIAFVLAAVTVCIKSLREAR